MRFFFYLSSGSESNRFLPAPEDPMCLREGFWCVSRIIPRGKYTIYHKNSEVNYKVLQWAILKQFACFRSSERFNSTNVEPETGVIAH